MAVDLRIIKWRRVVAEEKFCHRMAWDKYREPRRFPASHRFEFLGTLGFADSHVEVHPCRRTTVYIFFHKNISELDLLSRIFNFISNTVYFVNFFFPGKPLSSSRTAFLSESMASIQYERKGGYFVSTTKIVVVGFLFVVVVVAVGLLVHFFGKGPATAIYRVPTDGQVGNSLFLRSP